MNVIKTIVILGILIAPYLLMQHANAEEVTVQIADGAKKVDNGKFYVPAKIVVPVGATVVWKNFDDAPHTVTSGTPDCTGQCWGLDFDSGILRLDGAYKFTFDKAGTYPYLCSIHPWMIGTITVVAPGQEAPVELSVKPDRDAYNVGDTVAIEGSVSVLIEGKPLMIEILNPNNEPVVSDSSVSVGSDGKFSYNFKLADDLASGTYTIKATYSDAHTEVTFAVEKGMNLGEGKQNQGKDNITPGENGNANVKVTAKQIKDLLLVRVKNAESSTASVYSVTIETSDPVIEAFRGPRNWNNGEVSPTGASSSVEDEPLKPGGGAVFKVKIGSDASFIINWSAYDSNHNTLDQGQANPIRR